MGEAVLAACPQMESLHLSLPNVHCLLIDLSRFGLTNANEVFVPTDEPHGLIEARLTRG
jgi:urate oxidase